MFGSSETERPGPGGLRATGPRWARWAERPRLPETFGIMKIIKAVEWNAFWDFFGICFTLLICFDRICFMNIFTWICDLGSHPMCPGRGRHLGHRYWAVRSPCHNHNSFLWPRKRHQTLALQFFSFSFSFLSFHIFFYTLDISLSFSCVLFTFSPLCVSSHSRGKAWQLSPLKRPCMAVSLAGFYHVTSLNETEVTKEALPWNY